MNYTKILPFDLANGTGIRVSLFLSGCNFHCPDCFNQESQHFDYGKPFTSNTVDTIFELISNMIIMDNYAHCMVLIGRMKYNGNC